jgi:hypothetical protein
MQSAAGVGIEGVETVAVTKEQLAQVLAKWEAEARTGQWQPAPDLSVEEVATASADYLWPKLMALA